ncbi:hypothetical protein Tco_0465062 [Tanacetum coccineum]
MLSKNDDAHEHVERVLDIVSLYNIPGISHDVVMLRVFPITLTGATKRWVDRLPPGTVDSWDLLKMAFIQRYSPPSKTAKQLEEIRNFKQERDETLYQAWEQYNDLLYKCPIHDINNHQKVNIFYNGLGALNHQLLDLQGPILGMTPVQALTAIQTMADHSQKWHDGSSSRNIESSSNYEGIVAIVNNLENLDRDMKKLKENVHAIQVGCQIYRGSHLDKDYPLNEEIKSVEEVKYGEFGRPFPNRNDGRFNRGGYDHPSLGERRPRFSDYERQETDDSRMAEAALEAVIKIKKEEPKIDKQNVNYYVDPYETLIPFPRRLEQYAEESLVHQTMESLKKIKINRPLLKEIRQTDYYAKQMKELVENKPRTNAEKEIKMNPRCSAVLQNHLPLKEHDLGSFIIPCFIGKLDFKNALADLENLEDPEEYGEDKANTILGVIHDKLNNDWFNNTSEDEDDLEGILDYLKPRSYDGFIDLDDEAYNKRRFSLRRNGIRGLLDSFSCGRKVLYRRNHKGYAVTDIITT